MSNEDIFKDLDEPQIGFEDDALGLFKIQKKQDKNMGPGRPKMMKKIKPMTINMEEELWVAFDQAVWELRGNKSEIIRQLVEEWLEQYIKRKSQNSK